VHSDVALTLWRDRISDNRVRSIASAASTGDASGDSGAGEIFDGTIVHTRLSGNSVTVRSSRGDATALAGAVITHGTLTASVVRLNRASALSPHGTAAVFGGGLVSDDRLSVISTVVEENRGDARGRTGSALGGGIFASDPTVHPRDPWCCAAAGSPATSSPGTHRSPAAVEASTQPTSGPSPTP
jgi:hypothetical protein